MAGNTKKLVAGFDGFVDSIARPVLRAAAPGRPPEYYPRIAALGDALKAHAGKSGSIELELLAKRPGGNAPLLAGGACALGMQVSLIGMLGGEGPAPLFRNALPARLYSYAPPGESLALEFGDGKIFFAPGVQLAGEPWPLVEAATGGRACALLREADAVAIVNWSELSFAPQLWQDVYAHAFAPAKRDKSRTVLFDLSDCSRRAAGETDGVLRLVGRFSARRTTLLSLNQNEADVLARRLPGGGPSAPQQAAEALRQRYGIDEVVVHTRGGSFAATARGVTAVENEILPNPVVSTGAGDHFNAALCCAAAHGYADAEKLDFATRFVRRYLAPGQAPPPGGF